MRPTGKIRNPVVVILLTIVTLGIYGLYWHYAMFKETNEFSNEGISGVFGLLITFFCSIVAIFLLPAQVGSTRKGAGMPEGVSALNGLWILLPIVGIFIWIFQTQNAANGLWESQGVTA
jgi:hypothetical protein